MGKPGRQPAGLWGNLPEYYHKDLACKLEGMSGNNQKMHDDMGIKVHPDPTTEDFRNLNVRLVKDVVSGTGTPAT